MHPSLSRVVRLLVAGGAKRPAVRDREPSGGPRGPWAQGVGFEVAPLPAARAAEAGAGQHGAPPPRLTPARESRSARRVRPGDEQAKDVDKGSARLIMHINLTVDVPRPRRPQTARGHSCA